MTRRSDNILRLQTHPAGAGAALRNRFNQGRYELVTNGPNPEFDYIGSDPYNTHVSTGLVVPIAPSASINNARYLFLLARASFRSGEQSPEHRGVRLVGIRQYADLVARIPAGEEPLASEGPPAGSTVTFHKEIKSPFWHPPDGNISWHVMIVNTVTRDTRNPANADGLTYQDARSPSLLFQTTGPYTPPNGGRPWGTPLAASLGNIHELRYPWRAFNSEYALDIPIPTPCDVLFFASVRQSDPGVNPSITDCAAMSVLSEEDQFLVTYNNFAQYGTIAGALVFDQNLGRDVP